jgi:hypothetical protein
MFTTPSFCITTNLVSYQTPTEGNIYREDVDRPADLNIRSITQHNDILLKGSGEPQYKPGQGHDADDVQPYQRFTR